MRHGWKGAGMKYRNLKLSFTLENTSFQVLSISLEKMVTPIPRHSHSTNSYELHYVSFGYGKLIADGQSYDVVPGTFYMTGPGVFHEQVSDPKDPMIEYGVYLQVLQDGALPDNGLVEKFLATKFWFGEADAALHEIMKRILSELELRPLGYESMLPALLQELILTILRLYQQRELAMAPARGSESKKIPDDMTYLKIEEAFLYNYRDLTLEQLASLVNLGTRQTQRLLQKHYGKNFSQKKTEARMSAACLLLQDLNTSIASVADKLGYSSSEHFTTAFKQFYGITPTSYRKKI